MGVIGFEADGAGLGAALAQRGCAVLAFDEQLKSPGTRAAMLARMQAAGVDAAASLDDLVRACKLVIVSDTGQAGVAADCAASTMQSGQVFLQICHRDARDRASSDHRDAANAIRACGALYIEGVPAEPLRTRGLATRLHLRGPRAADLAAALNGLGFNAVTHDEDISPLPRMPREEIPDAGAPRWRGELP